LNGAWGFYKLVAVALGYQGGKNGFDMGDKKDVDMGRARKDGGLDDLAEEVLRLVGDQKLSEGKVRQRLNGIDGSPPGESSEPRWADSEDGAPGLLSRVWAYLMARRSPGGTREEYQSGHP
jgi:hypothetical protein